MVGAERGHFSLESGLHTDTWLDLEAAFIDPAGLQPGILELAELLRPFDATAVCGPLVGGALVAQSVAARLGIRFYFTQRVEAPEQLGLFMARYRLPDGMRAAAGAERFVVVDDAISAGSSARATVAEIESLGAAVAAVGSIWLLGDRGENHFRERSVPVVATKRQALHTWEPADCPLCRAAMPLVAK